MMRARWTMAGCSSLLLLLLLLLLLGGGSVRAICPSVCLCSRGHRVVDCSSRGLTKLPPGLQHNIHFLNLSFNSLQTLDTELSHYGHLRTLDLSYNRLERLPAALPRSLWELRAAGNHLRSLDKNDTAYHWNLRQLDLSGNELERVVFINNTLPELRVLNLSHNRFWTVPTNLPRNLQAVDLSHNFLLQILPGSLDRLPRLARLYLHANRFTGLDANRRGDGGFGFERLSALQLVTLGDNPWACEEEEDIARLLRWAERTAATVLGCPCHTRPVCGGQKNRAVATATDTATDTVTELPPLWVDSSRGDDDDGDALDDGLEATSGYRGKSAARFETGLYHRGNNESGGDQLLPVWMSSTSSAGFSTTSSRMTSTLKPKVSPSQNSAGGGLRLQSVTLTVLMTTATINSF